MPRGMGSRLATCAFYFLFRFCESERESIFRLRHEGNSYRSIADRLGVSVFRVRKELVN